MSIAFHPTADELDLLRRIESGVPVPSPQHLKAEPHKRLYENGFVTVRTGGALGLTLRGAEVLARARAFA